MKMTATISPMSNLPIRKVSDSEDAAYGCLTFIFSLANLFFGAWAVTLFWSWFLVPVFNELQTTISLWQAIGLLLTLRLVQGLRLRSDGHIAGQKMEFCYSFVATLWIALILSMGWLLHLITANGLVS